MNTVQPVVLRPINMVHGSWREELLRVIAEDGNDRRADCFLIVFPDIDYFHATEAVGGLYNLRRHGPLGELGRDRVTAIPMPTRRLISDGADAVTSSYQTERDFNLPGVREAIDIALNLLRNLLRDQADVYRFIYYFVDYPQNVNLQVFELEAFVCNYVISELERIVGEENRLRGW